MPRERPSRRRTAVANSMLEKQHPGRVCGVDKKAAAPIAVQEWSLIISVLEEE